MSGFRETGIIGKKTQVIMPEDPEAAPVTDYGNYLAIIEETEEVIVDETRTIDDAAETEETVEYEDQPDEEAFDEEAVLSGEKED